jgi:hypothetical protein
MEAINSSPEDSIATGTDFKQGEVSDDWSMPTDFASHVPNYLTEGKPERLG